MKTLSKGAEAIIFLSGSNVIKDRVKKSYRLPVLDEKLRRQRTKKESRLLKKAYNLIPVPKIMEEYHDKDTALALEHIKGKKLSHCLDSLRSPEKICIKIGENIAKLHDSDIIHGDLTTSNMLLKGNKLYFIDFGLGFESSKIEDKAVDLHLIKEAFEARHFKKAKSYFSSLLEGYKKSVNFTQVLKRLEVVEKRGRYKAQY